MLVADNTPTRDRLWEARKKLIEAVKHLSPQKIMETRTSWCRAPRSRRCSTRSRRSRAKRRCNIISFGHAGDGNVHVCVVKDMDDEAWRNKMPQAAERIYTAAWASAA